MRFPTFLFCIFSLFPCFALAETQVSITSFNIRFASPGDGENQWSKRKDTVCAFLSEKNYDVICLQESLASQIDEITGGVNGYSVLGVGRDDGKRSGEHTAILVKTEKFAIAATGTFWLSDTPDEVASKHWGNEIPRVCSWTRLIDKKTQAGFYVYNAHYDHQSETARRKGTLLITSHIAKRVNKEPVLLAGDFNTGEDSWSLKYLRGENVPAPVEGDATPDVLKDRFTDSFRKIHPDETNVVTFNGWRERTIGNKIDYVLMSPGVAVIAAEIIREQRDGRYLSDHHPVDATVSF